MPLTEAQAEFDAGFAERFRYALQQHERAILARIRQVGGEVGAEAEANTYENNLTVALFEVSRFVDERITAELGSRNA